MYCGVKNVGIIHADMGVALGGTYFCTVRGLVQGLVESQPEL
jgi:hypothetical protein